MSVPLPDTADHTSGAERRRDARIRESFLQANREQGSCSQRLAAAVRAKDAKQFQAILKEFSLLPYCIQVCAWFCLADCRCNDMCPPPPLINKVGDIMTSQPPYFVYPSWNATTNFAEGPSETVGPVPAANCAAGVGDHPFGGWAKINGLFNVEAFPFPDLTQYKVEYSTSASGPWTPILGSVQDAYIDYGGIFTGLHQTSPSRRLVQCPVQPSSALRDGPRWHGRGQRRDDIPYQLGHQHSWNWTLLSQANS